MAWRMKVVRLDGCGQQPIDLKVLAKELEQVAFSAASERSGGDFEREQQGEFARAMVERLGDRFTSHIGAVVLTQELVEQPTALTPHDRQRSKSKSRKIGRSRTIRPMVSDSASAISPRPPRSASS